MGELNVVNGRQTSGVVRSGIRLQSTGDSSDFRAGTRKQIKTESQKKEHTLVAYLKCTIKPQFIHEHAGIHGLGVATPRTNPAYSASYHVAAASHSEHAETKALDAWINLLEPPPAANGQ